MIADLDTARVDSGDDLAREFFVRLGVCPTHWSASPGATPRHVRVSAEMTADEARRVLVALVGHPLVCGVTYYAPDEPGPTCDITAHTITVALARGGRHGVSA